MQAPLERRHEIRHDHASLLSIHGNLLAEAYGVPFACVNPGIADPKILEVLPREFTFDRYSEHEVVGVPA